MKILFSADWHIKLWADKETTSENIPLRLHEIFAAIKQMCDYARQHSVELVVMAGDLNDKKNIIDVKAFVRLKKILEEYSDLQFMFLHGNHDSTARIDEDSSVELLSNDSNIRCHVVGTLVEDDITYVPYCKNMAELIHEAEPGKIFVSHFGLNEAILSNGHSIRSSITATMLSKFDMCFLGHYHLPQNIKNIYYVGNPVQMTRAESGEEKRFMVIDTETMEVESIPITGYRQYFELIIEDVGSANDIFEQAQQLQNEGHFVHIKKQIADAIEVPAELSVIDDYEEEYIIRGITAGMALNDQMNKYMEIEHIPEDEREEFLNIGLTGITGDVELEA